MLLLVVKLRRNSVGEICALRAEATGRRCFTTQGRGKLATGAAMGSMHNTVTCHIAVFNI